MNEKKQILNYFLIFGFVIYLAFLLWEFLFQNVPPTELFHHEYTGTININPYANISTGDILNQIILFIPLGLFLCILSRKQNIITKIWAIFAISLFLEFLSLLFFADFDITTVINNLIGGVVGIIIYKSLIIIFKDEEQIKGFVAILMNAIIIILAFALFFLSAFK